MKANTRVRSFSIVLILSVLFSLLQSAYVLVQADGATVEVFPLTGFYIEIKITFPSDITGNFAGTLEDKHFDCVTVPTNVLDCIGPIAQARIPLC